MDRHAFIYALILFELYQFLWYMENISETSFYRSVQHMRNATTKLPMLPTYS